MSEIKDKISFKELKDKVLNLGFSLQTSSCIYTKKGNFLFLKKEYLKDETKRISTLCEIYFELEKNILFLRLRGFVNMYEDFSLDIDVIKDFDLIREYIREYGCQIEEIVNF